LSGIAAGLIIALVAAPQMAPLLYHLGPADPVSIAGAALFLIVVAVIASLIPALRATRVDLRDHPGMPFDFPSEQAFSFG
jgi:ABC-type antimicrobial peptide transport system permease subunit